MQAYSVSSKTDIRMYNTRLNQADCRNERFPVVSQIKIHLVEIQDVMYAHTKWLHGWKESML